MQWWSNVVLSLVLQHLYDGTAIVSAAISLLGSNLITEGIATFELRFYLFRKPHEWNEL